MNKVFLAAGHYPSRPGACFEGFCEHDEAVLWVDAIKGWLGDSAIIVTAGTLRQKTDFVNARITSGDVAVELHFNSAMKDGEHIGDGAVTLYYPKSVEGLSLADACQEAMIKQFESERGCKEGWYRGNPAKGAYFFLARTRCPAVILEPQFIHKKEEIQDRREACCTDLAEALDSYISTGEKDVDTD